MIDYALWEVIENGATLPKTTIVEGKEQVALITSAEDKAQRRLEVKARSTLMMDIPNEHQLKFNSIKDAKKLLEAIEKRFVKVLGEKLLQEDVNQKLLRSLSLEWNTHAVVWRNKAELDTMSMDDLYDNLKVYEPEFKGMSSSSSSTQNMAFVSSSNNNTSSSNEVVNAAHRVTIASTQVNAAYSTNIDNLSNALTVNSNKTIGFDKSKVECYNCHKRGHFARECRAPRNQDNKNKEISRRSVPVETTTSTALVSCDGLGGYDWSDQAEEGPNYALMAYSSSSSDSEVSNDSNCSKSCMETVKLLKSQNDQLLRDLEKSSLMVLGYKTGLESVEEKLEFYKKNESVYVENINGLKWDIQVGEITIRELRKKLEKIQKEKDSIQFNVDKFENASKSLNKLIECQIVDNCKKGLGYEKYNAVPPPYTGNFMPPTPDLSFTGLDEFVNKPVVENSKAMSSEEEPKEVRKNDDAPIIEEWVSDSEEENVSQTKTEKKIVKPRNPKGGKITGKGTQSNSFANTKASENAGQARKETKPVKNYIFLPSWHGDPPYSQDPKSSQDDGSKPSSDDGKKVDEDSRKDSEGINQEKEDNVNSTNNVNAASINEVNDVDDEDVGAEADMHNLDTTIQVSPILTTRIHKDHPLDQVIHMNLFGPTFVKSLMKKMYCLVVIDDYSRFTWVFFIATKDETSGILKSFITGIENLVDHKVKVIRCDNGTEFKNREMNQFCEMKGILRQFSVARTPQQNGVAERRNRTLFEAARTMLADSKLPTTFWAEAVNNACYVQNRVSTLWFDQPAQAMVVTVDLYLMSYTRGTIMMQGSMTDKVAGHIIADRIRGGKGSRVFMVRDVIKNSSTGSKDNALVVGVVLASTKIRYGQSKPSRKIVKLQQRFRIVKMGCWFGEADSETSPNRVYEGKLFKTAA
ncbi:ribonuclease H-like domain-containing protein [Tanacetum coccineum]|uniref:Ribonuclease H-like domain-containing protein n=1 Tax=Tanacetum coccineum TaxID=301880 RepID=A0ABQ5CFY5_9ASTR